MPSSWVWPKASFYQPLKSMGHKIDLLSSQDVAIRMRRRQLLGRVVLRQLKRWQREVSGPVTWLMRWVRLLCPQPKRGVDGWVSAQVSRHEGGHGVVGFLAGLRPWLATGAGTPFQWLLPGITAQVAFTPTIKHLTTAHQVKGAGVTLLAGLAATHDLKNGRLFLKYCPIYPLSLRDKVEDALAAGAVGDVVYLASLLESKAKAGTIVGLGETERQVLNTTPVPLRRPWTRLSPQESSRLTEAQARWVETVIQLPTFRRYFEAATALQKEVPDSVDTALVNTLSRQGMMLGGDTLEAFYTQHLSPSQLATLQAKFKALLADLP